MVHEQSFTQEELEWKECKAKCSLFTESLHQRLGHHAMMANLVELGAKDATQYDPYEDKSQNAQTFPIMDEEPEVAPEWVD